MTQKNKPYDLEALKQILARHSRVADAAREIGMDPHALTDTFRRRGLSASSCLAKVPVPAGMRVRQVTSRTNADGDVLGQSVKADLETQDPPRFEPVPPGYAIKGLSTYLGPQSEQRGQWVKVDQARVARDAAFWSACEGATLRYRGLAKRTRAPGKVNRNQITIYPLGDPHIGLLAWHKETGTDFDARIAERELFAVVADLVARAPASNDAILANLGDYVHAQNDKQLTPASGVKLDVDGRMAKVNEIAFGLMRRMVDLTLTRHRRVRVVTVPGNHDPDTARMLAIWLRAVYENEPRVTVLPNWNPFTYVTFGRNLFGFAHGDGAKPDNLPAIMATDVPELWGAATHRYWHTGHEHHKVVLETPGCISERHRTVAANDAWHNWKGYRGGKSLSAISYATEGGEISRITAELSAVRRRLAGGK